MKFSNSAKTSKYHLFPMKNYPLCYSCWESLPRFPPLNKSNHYMGHRDIFVLGPPLHATKLDMACSIIMMFEATQEHSISPTATSDGAKKLGRVSCNRFTCKVWQLVCKSMLEYNHPYQEKRHLKVMMKFVFPWLRWLWTLYLWAVGVFGPIEMIRSSDKLPHTSLRGSTTWIRDWKWRSY